MASQKQIQSIESSVRQWIIPPVCQGQIVVVEYGADGSGTLYQRVTDRNDGSVAYYAADAADCGCGIECDCFNPGSCEPTEFEWSRIG